jgi:hypothetical protein
MLLKKHQSHNLLALGGKLSFSMEEIISSAIWSDFFSVVKSSLSEGELFTLRESPK